MTILRTARAAAAAVFLSAGAAAGAQPGAAPPQLPTAPVGSGPASTERPASPESLAASTELAHVYIDAAKPYFERGLASQINLERFDGIGDRAPQLQSDVRDAFHEAFDKAKPEIESIFAHALATHYSAAELTAGAKFMGGPGGRYTLELYESGQSGRPAPRMSTAAAAALQRMTASPSGRAFMRDFQHIDVVLKDYENEAAAAIIPPGLTILADKMQASEARRLDAREAAGSAGAEEPSAEAQSLGVSIMHDIYGLPDDQAWAMVSKLAVVSMTKSMDSVASYRPEWPVLCATTIVDTLRQDQPLIEQAGGRALARIYTPEELKALSGLMSSPAPAYMFKAAIARSRGEPVDPPMAEVKGALQAFAQDGMAQRLSDKLKNKAQLRAVGVDLAFTVVPAWLHRLGEQMEAGEQARRAARGW